MNLLECQSQKNHWGRRSFFLPPVLWLHFHGNRMCQFWIIRLNALWIKTICFQAKDWLFLWQNHILMWKVGYDESWEYFEAFCDFLLNPTFKLMGGSEPASIIQKKLNSSHEIHKDCKCLKLFQWVVRTTWKWPSDKHGGKPAGCLQCWNHRQSALNQPQLPGSLLDQHLTANHQPLENLQNH